MTVPRFQITLVRNHYVDLTSLDRAINNKFEI